LAVMVKHMVYG